MKEKLHKLKLLTKDVSLLIVEDDETLLHSLTKLLEHFFTSIYTATNIKDALSIYGKRYLDEHFLVISDINLGRENGVDLSYALRSLSKHQRIIAISASDNSTMLIDAIECGIDRFLLKPIKQEKLIETLLEVLRMMEYDRELEESQRLLEESREYALKLLAAQDEFVKNAIHEINTPLAIIITNIDLLRLQGIENRSLDAIEAGSRTIQNSYEDMTYLMKHHREVETKELIDLAAFVSERCHYFEAIAAANDIAFEIDAEKNSQTQLHFSHTKLSRLVDNTLSNAIKYAQKPSSVSITVESNEQTLTFSVNNHGAPIQDTNRVFERLYRESSTKGGYGLGLHIVWLICKEEDVSISIDSNAADGTTFSYTFTKNKTKELA